MKIQIRKNTVINGKPVRMGAVCDAAFIAPRDLQILLKCGCAIVLPELKKPEQKIETATATPKIEKAVAVAKPRSRGKKR